jgi:vacuolar-type H+-ATPase subunit H
VLGFVLWLDERRQHQAAIKEYESARVETLQKLTRFEEENGRLRQYVKRLAKWARLVDAENKAEQMLAAARARVEKVEQEALTMQSQAEATAASILEQAKAEAGQLVVPAKEEAAALVSQARAKSKQLTADAERMMSSTTARSQEILSKANQRAEEIAGKAYDVVRNAELYERTVTAMKTIIDGYGDRYLIPAESLLDELAEEFGHKEAGQKLKQARATTAQMVREGKAARCDYSEANRRTMAERFVIDAFNGKVDSILSRVRHDNAGTLEQEIRDAYSVVNFNGRPFRDARVTEEFLDARLQELKWAAIAQELKVRQQEEQRRLREEMREEEKARREFEKAMKEAAKEEEMLRDAMAKASARLAEATAEQKAQYEQQLGDLQSKLVEAEERNQRAISMAQQTKRGNVYIISNVGSLGENVYKIGMTRRLEPLDRVRELGGSSVPFEFDVHALIQTEDAPALEHQLHRHFVLNQINKVNHRREFFRADLPSIRKEIETLGIEATWTMMAEAREYRETLAIERRIADDPAARDQWVKRQLTLDMVDKIEAEDDDLAVHDLPVTSARDAAQV